MSVPYPAETNDGVVTSWIPLTTVWKSVSGCSNSLMLEGTRLVAYDPGYGISIDSAATCHPPAMTTWWEQGRLGGGSGPGHTAVSILPLTCPEGFSTVVTSIKDRISTLAMCCPPGYTLANGTPGSVAGDCISNAPSGATLTYASTPLTDSNTWTITSTTLRARSTIGAIGVVGWRVNLAVVTSTSINSINSTISTISTASATSTTSSNSLQPTSTSTFPPAPSSDLSTAARIGLGVGIALGVIGLIALVGAIWVSRRRKSKTRMQLQPEAPDWGQKPELDSSHTALYEIDNSRGPVQAPVYELPDTRF